VLAQEILAGQVLIETEDMRRVVINAADVLTVLSRGSPRRPEPEQSVDESVAILDEEATTDSTSMADNSAIALLEDETSDEEMSQDGASNGSDEESGGSA
jgi:hypothetical protein